ncbi:Uncharacterized conserved protein (some members containing a von Willebrand factor type A (vWA) domain) [Rubrobacter radiotolerans]|uniref:DUF58 domain-containing protein n=1 Tax=Rubrobacter radiotolerans TaxID=42256 RepID=A0A023X5G0_RUBRA|nr:DUF58 domain-containing protein [Rubrobacter radiotolerans]AHY47702.1 Uncharacterized conserved protein (some members containing a von Willebrand factor type A (vWA) domain) [Rubrobacter radiotolerans]MDX5895105.1 DUF58 domain-containing protein [Rubrobacter radiotolerans]SMC07465.1 Uncharacterized conserved protein, DUF58 family, contains vWF domain [Rubrobacter radiotolerans DSM 5868]
MARGATEDRSRLSVRLTARGWQAVVIGALVVVAARLIGTTQLHQLGYVLLALPVCALLCGLLFARGLVFSRRPASADVPSAGESVPFELVAENRSRFGTSAVEGTDRFPETVEFELDPLPAGESGSATTSVRFVRRGVYTLGPATLSVVDPFEMVGFTRTFEAREEVVVYPRVHELRDFPVRGGQSGSGGRGSVGRRGEEFSGLREYRRGDDRRHIHWKSLARTGELYVREVALDAPRRYTVALDLKRTGIRSLEAPVEEAVSAAASVISHLHSNSIPFRLVHTGSVEDGVPTEGGGRDLFHTDDGSFRREMRTLATVRPGNGGLIRRLLEEGEEPGEGVVLIARGADDELLECARRLLASGVSVVAVLVASHTYAYSARPVRAEGPGVEETRFLKGVETLERAGAVVRTVEARRGVASLDGAPRAGALGRSG